MDLCVLAFDPAWSGNTGWARIDWGRGRFISFESGVIVPRGKAASPLDKAIRASFLADAVCQVIKESDPGFYRRFVVAYESPLHWLVAKATTGQAVGGRKPVTRKSLVGMAFAVCSFLAGVGLYLDHDPRGSRGIDDGFDVVQVDTLQARRALGVDTVLHQAPALVDNLAARYGDRKKGAVGAALALHLEQRGLGRIEVLTHDQADAGVFALFVVDQEVLALRQRQGAS